jgi:hypothetical protein
VCVAVDRDAMSQAHDRTHAVATMDT